MHRASSSIADPPPRLRITQTYGTADGTSESWAMYDCSPRAQENPFWCRDPVPNVREGSKTDSRSSIRYLHYSSLGSITRIIVINHIYDDRPHDRFIAGWVSEHWGWLQCIFDHMELRCSNDNVWLDVWFRISSVVRIIHHSMRLDIVLINVSDLHRNLWLTE